jgi:hypothetical protein
MKSYTTKLFMIALIGALGLFFVIKLVGYVMTFNAIVG